MEALCKAEVLRLHRFLERWLAGTLQRSEAQFDEFAQALADDFVIIHPSGNMEGKEHVLADLHQAHGVHTGAFSIEIRNLRCRVATQSWCLLTYEEWQHAEDTSARLSSALLRRCPDGQRVQWVHLHETWLPRGSG
jgi:hypothetical protein